MAIIKNRRIIFLVIIFFFVAVIAGRRFSNNSFHRSVPNNTQAQTGFDFKVGYQIRQISYVLPGGSSKDLTMAIWYPAVGTPANYKYNRMSLAGFIILDGAPDKTAAPYPLVIFSHGYLGGGNQSVFLTQYLAKRGYVVVSMDHEDAFTHTIVDENNSLVVIDASKSLLANFPHRPLDVKAALDEILRLNQTESSLFYHLIDAGKISMAGHSLGGWTAQVITGAAKDPAYVPYKDNRITNTILLAPQLEQTTVDGWPFIFKPLLMVLADQDPANALVEKGLLRRAAYDVANPPKFLPIVSDANHLIFADIGLCPLLGAIESCQQSVKAQVILKYTLAFLERYSIGDIAYEEQLKTSDVALSSYEYLLSAILNPNIILSKTVNKAETVSGDEITYTITYNNIGQGQATNIVITDTIPIGASYVAGSATAGGALNSGILTWTVATLPANQSGSVSFKVKAE